MYKLVHKMLPEVKSSDQNGRTLSPLGSRKMVGGHDLSMAYHQMPMVSRMACEPTCVIVLVLFHRVRNN